MGGSEDSKAAAQKRADRIRAFRAELRDVERDGGVTLSEDQRDGLRRYHDRILRDLSRQFDVDTTDTQKQMSWGMRIVSTLGASALAIAVYFFFYRFWGSMTTPVQVTALVAAPILVVVGMEFCSRRERTLYFTGLLGLVAFACFVLNVHVLGDIFNITPSQRAFLAWGIFGVVLGYVYGLRLILGLGFLSLMAYLSTVLGSWGGTHWVHSFERPENCLVVGLLASCVPLIARHRVRVHFPVVYRLLGLLAALFSILVLANWGKSSYLPMTPDAIEILYQLLGFVVAGLAIWVGIRKGLNDTTYLGSAFFMIFLYVKFFDWWWDLLPKYLFFLILGSVAVGLMLLLNRVRSRTRSKVTS